MTRKHWVFFEPCGCPFGLVEAIRYPNPLRRTGTPRELTKTQAWRDMFETAKERNEAFDQGVTSELMDHATYEAEIYPRMSPGYKCPHGGAS